MLRAASAPGASTAQVVGQLPRVLGEHRRRVDLEVDVGLRAHLLDEHHRGLIRVPGRASGGQRRVLEVLGPDAEHDLPADVVAQGGPGGQHLVVQAQAVAAEPGHQAAAGRLEVGLGHVHGRRADEAGHEEVDRVVVEHLRGVDLLQHAPLHHGDPVGHGHGLGLVVGDVERGDLEVALDAGDLGPGLHPQLGVQVGERLVHEERARLADDGPAHRHPLALTAGEVPRLAGEELLEAEHPGRLATTRRSISSFGVLRSFRPKPMFSPTVRCG